jgi:predicted DNA binding protein
MAGIRTELTFDQYTSCPVARASTDLERPVTDITWTDADGDEVTEQFTADELDDTDEFEEVFDYGQRTVYEFDREVEDNCVCEHIQESLGPVTSVHARNGALHVTIHAPDMDHLRELISDLRESFGDVSMEYLVQSRDGDDDPELVPVDLQRLTDRQREVLHTAYEMGYFEYPGEANASEVAEELGIAPSTFAEHLSAAQSKMFDELLPVEA